MLRFLILVGGVMMSSASMAEGVSTCPVDLLPIQLVDEYGTHSETNPKPGFFVGDVAGHIVDRLGREGICLNSTESKERSLIQFVSWPLRSENKPITPMTLPNARPSNGCRVLSPWIDIVIERKPIPWVRAIVRSNTRQFLADQAVLAGAKNVPPGVAKPLTNSEFSRFVSEYKKHEDVKQSHYDDYYRNRDRYERNKDRDSYEKMRLSRESGESAAKLVEESVPPDLLWLFHRSAGKFFGEAIEIAMLEATKKSAGGSTKLILTLIDRCFAADGANLKYNSILDVADPILLEQYKVDMPTVNVKLP